MGRIVEGGIGNGIRYQSWHIRRCGSAPKCNRLQKMCFIEWKQRAA